MSVWSGDVTTASLYRDGHLYENTEKRVQKDNFEMKRTKCHRLNLITGGLLNPKCLFQISFWCWISFSLLIQTLSLRRSQPRKSWRNRRSIFLKSHTWMRKKWGTPSNMFGTAHLRCSSTFLEIHLFASCHRLKVNNNNSTIQVGILALA